MSAHAKFCSVAKSKERNVNVCFQLPVSCVCNHCKHGPAGHCQSDFARTKTSRAFRIMTWWRAPHPITGQGMSLTRCHTLMLHTMPNLSMPKLMCVSGGKLSRFCASPRNHDTLSSNICQFSTLRQCEHAAWGNGMWPLFHCANCWIASPLQPLDRLRYIWSYTSIYVIINPYSLSSLWRRFSSQEDLQRHFRDWNLWHLWIKAFPAADHAIRGSRPCRKQKMLENWKTFFFCKIGKCWISGCHHVNSVNSLRFQWFQWFRDGRSGCLVEARWRRLVMDGVRRRPKTQWVLKISGWWIYAAVPFPKCRQWSSMNWESPLASLDFGDRLLTPVFWRLWWNVKSKWRFCSLRHRNRWCGFPCSQPCQTRCAKCSGTWQHVDSRLTACNSVCLVPGFKDSRSTFICRNASKCSHRKF